MSVRMVDGVPRTVRGSSNRNDRGSAEQRRKRKAWLMETYRADVDTQHGDFLGIGGGVALGSGVPACRCYRCGSLLTFDTMTVDRIIPGCKGGTYRRTNIRPACGDCNSETGGALSGHARRSVKR